MLLFENISLALNAIKSNITRSILTMLGIVIGVAAVIGIMTVGNALSSQMDEEFNNGATDIEIGLSEKSDDNDRGPGGMRGMGGPSREKTASDYITDKMIADVQSKYADRISAILIKNQVADSATAIDGNKKAYVSIIGVNEAKYKAYKYDLLAGRSFSVEEYTDAKKVAIVSGTMVENLFDGDNDAAIGAYQSVLVDGRYYTYKIVGVYEPGDDEYSEDSEDTPTDMYIPINAALNQTHKYNQYEDFVVTAKERDDVEALEEDIKSYMNRRYYRDNAGFEISTFTMLSLLESLSTMMDSIRLGLSLVAGISLLVGGIGVMNIMLVSITERTKEIGTRKALGATNTSIRVQFIVESIVLCIVGGAIGVVLGIVIGYFGCKAMEATFSISGISIMIAVGFSAIVGMFFGYYPANKAAKMNPIDALRYE